MKRMYRAAALRPLLAVSVVALSGCVSVFEGTSQDINVVTNPTEASCTLEREGQTIGSVPKTPGVVTVRKSKYDITVKCNKPGYQEAAYVNHSGVSSAIAANIVVDLLLTAGISSIVDSANGADNKYDPVVNISLVPVLANTASNSASPVTATPAAATATDTVTPTPAVDVKN